MCKTSEQEELAKRSKCKNIRVYNNNIIDNLNKLTHDIIYIKVIIANWIQMVDYILKINN